MGLFKEKFCVHCGKKVGMMKTTLVDGQYLCGKCTKPVPFELSKFLSDYDYDGFKSLLDYLENSENIYKKMFRETHKFFGLHLDTEHALFYLDNMYPRVYLRVDRISDCKLSFDPETIKEGFLGDKVTGNVYLKLKVDFPYIYIDDVFAKDVKASATTKGLLGKKVVYDNPKGMDQFYRAFVDCWERAVEERAGLLKELAEMEHLEDSESEE